ncbi:hypothetical protein Tco_1399412, partial [Tanacetum coccineum]
MDNFRALCDAERTDDLTILQVPDCSIKTFKWVKLYASALSGNHSYAFRDQEKHI